MGRALITKRCPPRGQPWVGSRPTHQRGERNPPNSTTPPPTTDRPPPAGGSSADRWVRDVARPCPLATIVGSAARMALGSRDRKTRTRLNPRSNTRVPVGVSSVTGPVPPHDMTQLPPGSLRGTATTSRRGCGGISDLFEQRGSVRNRGQVDPVADGSGRPGRVLVRAVVVDRDRSVGQDSSVVLAAEPGPPGHEHRVTDDAETLRTGASSELVHDLTGRLVDVEHGIEVTVGDDDATGAVGSDRS